MTSVHWHTYTHTNPWGKLVTTRNHQADRPLYVWPDCLIWWFAKLIKYGHSWHQMSFLRQHNPQILPAVALNLFLHLMLTLRISWGIVAEELMEMVGKWVFCWCDDLLGCHSWALLQSSKSRSAFSSTSVSFRFLILWFSALHIVLQKLFSVVTKVIFYILDCKTYSKQAYVFCLFF